MSFQRAAALADVPDGGALGLEIDGKDVALIRDGDAVYAIEDMCSRAMIPLSDGDVEGCEIECFLHGSRFDVRTGKPVNLPATQAVPTYAIRLEGDDVLVDLDTPATSEELNA